MRVYHLSSQVLPVAMCFFVVIRCMDWVIIDDRTREVTYPTYKFYEKSILAWLSNTIWSWIIQVSCNIKENGEGWEIAVSVRIRKWSSLWGVVVGIKKRWTDGGGLSYKDSTRAHGTSKIVQSSSLQICRNQTIACTAILYVLFSGSNVTKCWFTDLSYQIFLENIRTDHRFIGNIIKYVFLIFVV